ncbi:hypothetical protein BDZ89DRAFT_1073918 [Hymenopellis radicata]|nr:hypothetical protein BDZ89DRAFT_1073918 [Hymenopellis radicata]
MRTLTSAQATPSSVAGLHRNHVHSQSIPCHYPPTISIGPGELPLAGQLFDNEPDRCDRRALVPDLAITSLLDRRKTCEAMFCPASQQGARIDVLA